MAMKLTKVALVWSFALIIFLMGLFLDMVSILVVNFWHINDFCNICLHDIDSQGWKEVSKNYHRVYENSTFYADKFRISRGLLFSNESTVVAFREFREIMGRETGWVTLEQSDEILLQAIVLDGDIHISENPLIRVRFEVDCRSSQSVLKRLLVPEGLAAVYAVSEIHRNYLDARLLDRLTFLKLADINQFAGRFIQNPPGAVLRRPTSADRRPSMRQEEGEEEEEEEEEEEG
jgi:hypothetical protein